MGRSELSLKAKFPGYLSFVTSDPKYGDDPNASEDKSCHLNNHKDGTK